MKPKEIPLEEGLFYHIYNRGNNRERLFYRNENYRFFLRRYDEYLSDYVETYSFCLLPNHFHLLVRVKELPKEGVAEATLAGKASGEGKGEGDGEAFGEGEATLFKKVSLLNPTPNTTPNSTPNKISIPNQKNTQQITAATQFHRLFTSYAKAINKQEGRVGSLFQRPFKRIEIASTQYLSNLVFYIHANPQLHGITDDFRQYPWSSYNAILSKQPTKLQKDSVINWFNDKDNFIYYHNAKANLAEIRSKIINLED